MGRGQLGSRDDRVHSLFDQGVAALPALASTHKTTRLSPEAGAGIDGATEGDGDEDERKRVAHLGDRRLTQRTAPINECEAETTSVEAPGARDVG